MSKLKAGRGVAGSTVTEKAVQILGGAGYVRDHPVERWYRRRQDLHHLRGHQRDPAAGDRPRDIRSPNCADPTRPSGGLGRRVRRQLDRGCAGRPPGADDFRHGGCEGCRKDLSLRALHARPGRSGPGLGGPDRMLGPDLRAARVGATPWPANCVDRPLASRTGWPSWTSAARSRTGPWSSATEPAGRTRWHGSAGWSAGDRVRHSLPQTTAAWSR